MALLVGELVLAIPSSKMLRYLHLNLIWWESTAALDQLNTANMISPKAIMTGAQSQRSETLMQTKSRLISFILFFFFFSPPFSEQTPDHNLKNQLKKLDIASLMPCTLLPLLVYILQNSR